MTEYENILRAMYGGVPTSAPTPSKPKPEKGVPWEAKVIDGAYYVPLRQVADLLAANDVLPGVRKGIERRTAEER